MKNVIILSIFLIIFSIGCSVYHVNSQDITASYYPSKMTADDVVYLETVNRPYEVIGYVQVNTERRQSISEVIQKMKREAAILGGDAITDIKTDATGVWKRLPAQDIIGNAYVRANFTANVIVFK